ncbi:hypothetical protein DICSQDRAFT_95569 [Dichomitus squalens LYAD-421 SS1]|uniref:uncharacterized protein n=1 Tax=Dichomitus squalens (strain LYAD-421) TaxID=732165 RepID=UPI00044131F0|nr:uncharacterized protein DICSQDRAFT_95569 [Dichomitus squalens LYAD-421 SS1]EJF66802.1 hypothetical protein DICSQDRAFT_95569 [Dichomitus squalens LYAD-421 SS1]
MSIAPEPSASRGEITLQPSYFTSSLYVDPLREDISKLIASFDDQFKDTIEPFALFKKLWTDQGWCWLHMRAYDGRARQSFICTTERVFAERVADTEDPIARVVALFCLYTFYNTQPSTSAPPFYSVANIAVPMDIYRAMVSLPAVLHEEPLFRLRPYVVHILTTLLNAQTFYILPDSSLRAQNPTRLPREIFVPEGQGPSEALHMTAATESAQQEGPNAAPKKKGRPSKRDKARKVKEALASLERYIDRNAVALPGQHPPHVLGPDNIATHPHSTHVVFGQAPHATLNNYVDRRNELLAAVHAYSLDSADTTDASRSRTKDALQRANEAVLLRLKQIDAMAAEQGLEVGGEGGEKTGLSRVERAVDELRQSSGVGASGGILSLLEGAGMDSNN